MKKIIKWCRYNLASVKYKRYFTEFGRRCFYNDGSAGYEEYILKMIGYKEELKLIVKITGRPQFRLVKDEKIVAIAFSQDDLIKYLDRNKDMYGNNLFGGD